MSQRKSATSKIFRCKILNYYLVVHFEGETAPQIFSLQYRGRGFMNERAIAICPMREALFPTRSPLQVDYAGAPSPVDTLHFARYTFGNWREPCQIAHCQMPS